MKRVVLVFLILAMCLSICACNSETYDTWPTTGLAEKLPNPNSEKLKIGLDIDTMYSATISEAGVDGYKAYVEKCKSSGFKIDVQEDSDSFEAYNPEGYLVNVDYRSYNNTIDFTIEAPKVNGDLIWPTIGLATIIPKPDSNKGKISIDSSSQFVAYVGEISYEEYNDYVQQCIKCGFDIDHSKSDEVYSAKLNDGTSLRVEYEGFNTMYISMYASNESDSTESSKENESVSVGDDADVELVDGMRPAFKEALDSYEAFIDEYCEFMKKYMDNPTDLSLLNDYTEYMSKYADTMSKIDDLDDGNMNEAETKYYIEVTGRISKKLLEISIEG